VTGPTGHVFHATLGSNNSKYMVLGEEGHVLILESTTAAGPITHRVTSVDFTTAPPTERLVLTGIASSGAVPPPVVQHSQGSGSVFMIFSSSGTQVQHLAMHRSGNGEVVCAGPPPFVPTGETRGEASDTDLVIHFSSGQQSRETSCSLLPHGTGDVFLLGGDSGSAVVDDNRRVVGLAFASNEEVKDANGNVILPEGAIGTANPIQAVLDTLDVRLCQGGGGGTGGGGGGGVIVPPRPRPALSVLKLASQCLDREPPLSVRRHIFRDVDDAPRSLRTRLREIRERCD
jgi:hypothetical protein